MKVFRKIIIAASLILATSTTMSVANNSNMKPIYIFGFSASFNDSIVYFTDIQHVDSAWIEKKTNFLLGRENYSYQLRDYLSETKSQPHRTCMIVYSFSKKDIIKKLANMKKKYIDKNTSYDIKYLTAEEFSFRYVDMSPVEEEVTEQTKAPKEKKGKQRPDRKGKPDGKGHKGMPPRGMEQNMPPMQ